jgi:hypothetical protein
MMRASAFGLIVSLCTASNVLAGPKETDNLYSNTMLALQQVDISTFTEVDIHAPAKVVWRYLTDMRIAERYSPGKYRLESGAWGEVGSVFEVLSTVGGKVHPFPKMRGKLIDSIPYKYFVLRCSSQVSEDAIERLEGYDVYVLQESTGITKLAFVQALSFGNLNITKEDLPAFKEGQRKFIGPIFEDLKRLVESEYRP